MTNKTKKALVIKVDGIDGCGKTTLLKELFDFYIRENYRVSLIKEYGGNEDTIIKVEGKEFGLYDMISSQAKSCENDLDDIERELLWVIVGRRTNLRVIPSIACSNDIIFVDRSNLGNLAYGNAIDPNLSKIYDFFSTNVEVTDMTIWLDTPVDICLQRISSRRKDKIEMKDENFFIKVRENFKSLAKSSNTIRVIDGTKDIETVVSKALILINDLLVIRKNSDRKN